MSSLSSRPEPSPAGRSDALVLPRVRVGGPVSRGVSPLVQGVALFLLGLVLALALGTAASGEPADPADAVLGAYYDALQSGDVGRIGSLIGGRLLRQQQALLSNPMYSEHLVEAYGERSFRIAERSQPADAARILVLVEETIAADEWIRLQYTLEWSSDPGNSGFRIVDVVAVP